MRANFDNKLSELNKKAAFHGSNDRADNRNVNKNLLKSRIQSLPVKRWSLTPKINEAEREVERICLNLLLQQQPVFAEDLRRVSAAL